MKTKSLSTTMCLLILFLSMATPGFAEGENGPASMAIDVLIARPITFAATMVGSALFVVSLPIAATSRSIKASAETLIAAPARDTFTRPLGDLDDFMSY
jgi:hypothetical protein